jgi:hypothetical protein
VIFDAGIIDDQGILGVAIKVAHQLLHRVFGTPTGRECE